MDRITGLQVFVRAATLGSITAAARDLGMSQTMATKHLADLEGRIGSKLLHRTTRRLSLTQAGRTFLDATERILADLEEAEARAGSDHVEVRGLLRLNVPVSYGVRQIAPLIPAFTTAHPGVRIELGLNDRVVDVVEEGWDMAIRIGELVPSSLIARRLAPCPTAVCAAPSYLATRGIPRTIADLNSHNCLGYTLSRLVGAHSWAFGKAGSATVAISGSLQSNNGDALLAAAVAGEGIIYVPRFLANADIASGRLSELRLDHPSIALGGIYAVYPPGRSPPAKVRAFIDFLAARLAAPAVSP